MAIKTWTGNAQAVAQVQTYTPGPQLPGTTLQATINGKVASYTSPTGANDDLVSGLATAASNLGQGAPEFNEVTFAATPFVPAVPSPNSTYLSMTAKTAGVPFIISLTLIQPASVTVTRLQAGVAGVNEVQQITIAPNAESGSSFTLSWGGDTTIAVPTPPAAPMAAANGTGNLANGGAAAVYYWAVTFMTVTGETEPSLPSAALSLGAQQATVTIPLGPSITTARRIYRTLAGAPSTGPYYLVDTVGDNATTTYTDNAADTAIKPNAGPPATNGALQNALESLASIGVGNVKVNGANTAAYAGMTMPSHAIVYTVTFCGTLGNSPQALLNGNVAGVTILPPVSLTQVRAGAPPQDEIQQFGWQAIIGTTLPSGTFTLTLPGLGVTTAPIVFNASAASVQAALVAAAGPAYGGTAYDSGAAFFVTLVSAPSAANECVWQVQYEGPLGLEPVPLITVSVGGMVPAAGDTITAYQARIQPGTKTGFNAIEEVTLDDGPTGGTFGVSMTLSNGNTISATGVPYNASAATFQEAWPAGTAEVTGAAGGPYAVEAVGEAGSQVIQWNATSSLSGGEQPPGSPPGSNTATILIPTFAIVATGTTGGALATGTYFYRVTAANGQGETNGNELPVAVTGPSGHVTLSWPTVVGATSYNIYRGTTAGGENVKIISTTGTVYTDYGGMNTSATPPASNSTGLPAPSGVATTVLVAQGAMTAATYYYKITAVNSGGETTPSAEVNAVVATDGAVELSWSAVTGASGYKIYRGTSAGGENTLIATINSGTSTIFYDSGTSDTAGSPPTINTALISAPTGLVVSSQYFSESLPGLLPAGAMFYKVTATTAAGETTASNEASQAPNQGYTNYLTWSAVTGATGYKIYRGTAAGGENTLIASVGQIVSFLDSNGADPAATSISSDSFASGAITLSAITGAGASPASDWYYQIVGNNGASIGSAGTNNPTINVAAGDAVQISWSGMQTQGVTSWDVYRSNVPMVTGNSSTEVGTLIATLPVSQSGFVDSFEAPISAVPPGSNTALIPAPTTSYSVQQGGVLGVGTYYYKITSTTANGETAGSSEIAAVVSGVNSSIEITWQSAIGQDVKIYRGTTSGGENILVATVPATNTGLIDTGISAPVGATPPATNTAIIAAPTQTAPSAAGTGGALATGTYYYVVTAFTASGETTKSNEENIAVTGPTGAATLTWNADSGAIGYKIYRGTAAGAEGTLIATVNSAAATSFDDSGPTNASASPPGTNTAVILAPTQTAPSTSATNGAMASGTYYYVVTATDAAGETAASNEESIAVTGPTGEVTVNWSTVAGATGYKIYRGTTAAGENTLVGQVFSGAATSFVDVGTVPTKFAATEITRGASPAGEQQLVTLNGATGGTFALAFEGVQTPPLSATDTAADIAAKLAALPSIGANNVSVGGPNGGPYAVNFTGALGASPQPLIATNSGGLTGGVANAVTITTVTVSTGPNNWDNAANWSPVGVPQTGDTAVFQNTTVDAMYGLAQSAVTLANLQIDMSFVGGWIGLPNVNPNKYPEYRQQYLQIGVSGQVLIGNGSGSGPTLFKCDFGTSPFKMLVNNCGTSLDPTLPAIIVKGNRATGTSEIDVYKGKVGVAMFAGETATVDVIRQGYLTNQNSDTYVYAGAGCTLTNWYKVGGDAVLNAPITLLRHEGGTLTVMDGLVATTIATLALVGGIVTDRATGTITTLTVGTGAIYDRTDDSRVKTVTNTTLFGQSTFLDPHGSILFTNPILLSNCSIPSLTELDLGTNITLQRVQD